MNHFLEGKRRYKYSQKAKVLHVRSKKSGLRLLWTNKSPSKSPIKTQHTHTQVPSKQTTSGRGSCKSLFLPRCRPPSHHRPGAQGWSAPQTDLNADPDTHFSAPSHTLSLFTAFLSVFVGTPPAAKNVHKRWEKKSLRLSAKQLGGAAKHTEKVCLPALFQFIQGKKRAKSSKCPGC